MKTIVVTGGRGFIGSHFVREALERGYKVIDIDKVTYAGFEELNWDDHPEYTHIREDICDIEHLPKCSFIINFAAETHVDNSIRDTAPFIRSNILGVHNLLELVRGKPEYDRPLFIQVSTDEVYGDKKYGSFLEKDSLTPSNPYAASKAAAEHLVTSYGRTYGIDYIITRSGNNYGSRQYGEKLIPKIIDSLIAGEKIPLHGDGSYVRDWTYVLDNIEGMFHIIDHYYARDGKPLHRVFNIASGCQRTNNQVAEQVCSWLDEDWKDHVVYVPNRWGQDLRYSIDISRLTSIGWQPKHQKELHKWF